MTHSKTQRCLSLIIHYFHSLIYCYRRACRASGVKTLTQGAVVVSLVATAAALVLFVPCGMRSLCWLCVGLFLCFALGIARFSYPNYAHFLFLCLSFFQAVSRSAAFSVPYRNHHFSCIYYVLVAYWSSRFAVLVPVW